MLHTENLCNTIKQCYLNQNHPYFLNEKRIFRRFLEENEDKGEGNERTMDCEKAGRWMIQNSDRMTS